MRLDMVFRSTEGSPPPAFPQASDARRVERLYVEPHACYQGEACSMKPLGCVRMMMEIVRGCQTGAPVGIALGLWELLHVCFAAPITRILAADAHFRLSAGLWMMQFLDLRQNMFLYKGMLDSG